MGATESSNWGGVVSTTVSVCTQLELLPQSSVAVHVRVSIPVLPQPGCHWSLCVIVTVPHVSTAEAEPFASTLVSAGHCSVTSGGQVISGGVVSTTVMVCTQVELLPDSSVAVHVRTIVPALPQLGSHWLLCVIVTVPQVSVAVAWPVALGVVSAGHSRVTSGGQLISGGVVS